jgi:hypothetical protein
MTPPLLKSPKKIRGRGRVPEGSSPLFKKRSGLMAAFLTFTGKNYPGVFKP